MWRKLARNKQGLSWGEKAGIPGRAKSWEEARGVEAVGWANATQVGVLDCGESVGGSEATTVGPVFDSSQYSALWQVHGIHNLGRQVYTCLNYNSLQQNRAWISAPGLSPSEEREEQRDWREQWGTCRVAQMSMAELLRVSPIFISFYLFRLLCIFQLLHFPSR